jgi:hypothetical protein
MLLERIAVGEVTHRGFVIKAFEEFLHTQSEKWMEHLGGDLGQRNEDEASVLHLGMGDAKIIVLDDQIVEENDIDVDLSLVPFLPNLPPEPSLYSAKPAQEPSGRKLRLHNRSGVKELRLVAIADRFGSIE